MKKFSSYNTLKTELGVTNSIIESCELITTSFISESKDYDGDIKKLSHKYGIKVDCLDPGQFKLKIAQLYLVACFQHAERFLNGFEEEAKTIAGIKFPEKEKSIPLLKWMLSSFSGGFETNVAIIGRESYELFEYYRLVRNKIVHYDDDTKAVSNKFKELGSQKDNITEKYGIIEAPNKFGELKIWDAILFSRVFKKVAENIYKCVDIRDEKLLEYGYSIQGDNAEIKLIISRFSNNEKRREKSILNYIKTMAASLTVERPPP